MSPAITSDVPMQLALPQAPLTFGDILEANLPTPRGFTARTHYANQITEAAIGSTVTLNGWVHVNRDLGGITFVEIRDRTGCVQLVADPSVNPTVHPVLSSLRCEDVITATGVVRKRPEDTQNPGLASGTVEIYPESVVILSRAKTPPFPINDDDACPDERTRLRYRYLDIRRPQMANNLLLRHQLAQTIRSVLNSKGFIEFETPMLIKSTPEGARDYLVPSRVHAGHCYALPQSPQLYKQLLMVAGMERYYQIARCFRDEDLRADRQPEFTQIDMEMAFVGQDDVLALTEDLVQAVMAQAGVAVSLPLQRMTWHDAMAKYGSDKPDLRYDLAFHDFTDVFRESAFGAFQGPIANGGVVKALLLKKVADGFSRKELDDLQAQAKQWGAKGLAYIIYTAEGEKSPIVKYLADTEKAALIAQAGCEPGDILFFMADAFVPACSVLGRFREHFAKRQGLIDPKHTSLFWVVDFPMFDVDAETGALAPNHHPFTAPHPDDRHLLDTDPGKARALGYDLVLNGNEIGGGSVRIHDRALQYKIFELLKLSPEEIQEKFGFLLEAFEYGVPPHAGLALGFDRLCALLAGVESIRDVIAFPKTNQATCPMIDAPSVPNPTQTRDLHFNWQLPKTPEPQAK